MHISIFDKRLIHRSLYMAFICRDQGDKRNDQAQYLVVVCRQQVTPDKRMRVSLSINNLVATLTNVSLRVTNTGLLLQRPPQIISFSDQSLLWRPTSGRSWRFASERPMRDLVCLDNLELVDQQRSILVPLAAAKA